MKHDEAVDERCARAVPFLVDMRCFFKGAQLKTDSHLNNASNERLGSMMAEHVQCATCCSFL